MSEDMLSILNQSLDLVGKRDMGKEQLEAFIKNTLKYDVENIVARRLLFKKKEIKTEMEINNFPFFTDGYRVGAFIELLEDNIIPFRDDKGNEIQVRQLFQKKDGEYITDKNGDYVPTGRCLMKIKGRQGFMSVFIGLDKVEEFEEEHFYVLVGGLSTQWKVANTDELTMHKKKEKDTEYTDFPYHTLNVWQYGEIVKTKGGKLKVILPESNWKKKEEED